MHGFDYGAGAELFTNKSKWSRRAPTGHKRFARAADAIRFAIEGLPANRLASAWLEATIDSTLRTSTAFMKMTRIRSIGGSQ